MVAGNLPPDGPAPAEGWDEDEDVGDFGLTYGDEPVTYNGHSVTYGA